MKIRVTTAFNDRQNGYVTRPVNEVFECSEQRAKELIDSDRATIGRNKSDFDSVTGQRGGTQSVENGNNISAGAVQPNFKHSKYRTDDRLSETDFRNRTRVYGNKLEELSDGAEESFGTDAERNQVYANADDRIYPTGWEESRRVFEQYLAKRSGTRISNSLSSEKVNSADNLKMDSNNHTILGGINSLAESLSRIIDDESEDEEGRRKRIEAEQNGSDIGTLLGLTAGMIAGAISKEENNEYEEPDDSPTVQM